MNKKNPLPKVIILVLNWNQSEDTKHCLNFIRGLNYPNFETVVVDNSSTDGSQKIIETGFPEVVLIKNKHNLGCAGGRNVGIEYFLNDTDGDYLLFLDNDTEVDAELLNELVEVAESDSKTGIVGMKVFYKNCPEKFWAAGGGKINWCKGNFYDSGQGEIDRGQFDDGKEMDSVPGGFTFIKRAVLEKAGKLDEKYFIYYEDPDWCVRAKKAGFEIAFAPKARVWHKASSSLGMSSPAFYYYRTRNRLLFIYKNVNKTRFFLFMVYFMYDFSNNTLFPLMRDKKKTELKAALRGIFDFFTGNFGKNDRLWSGIKHQGNSDRINRIDGI